MCTPFDPPLLRRLDERFLSRHNVKMLTTIATIGGLAGVIISVTLLAWQTRSVAQQTKISNAIARASVISNESSSLRHVFSFFVEYPELRQYFYGSKRLPVNRHHRERILSVAEIFGDILEDGLVVNSMLPTVRFAERLPPYCTSLLITSPAINELLRQHPEWWPLLRSLHPRNINQSKNTRPNRTRLTDR